ncbi:LysR family transcriptional regulator [Arthrobacter sp. KK5.5]|uniref:LysR family transcriptional regulator n=1 Tax=Arthrobacter sp. KK5.5 TaxID=3373084 RepID=UPI003EE66985
MPKPFTLVQLRYFAVVAETQNMTEAAVRLNVTQSTLSSAIAQLESEVGAALFLRVPRRGLQLTESGRRLARELGAFLEEADRIQGLVAGEAESLDGELRVGVFAPLAPFRAPVILTEFGRSHPRVRVSFLEGDQAFIQRALAEGRCDVALMYHIGLEEGFTTRVVERIPPHVIVHAGHPLAGADRDVRLSEFADDPLILLDLPHTREYFLKLFNLAGVRPRIRHRATGYETVRAFVGQGHGYSVLNQRLTHNQTYAGGCVVPLTLADDLPPIEVLVVRPDGVRPTRKALAFEDVCRRLYGPTDA